MVNLMRNRKKYFPKIAALLLFGFLAFAGAAHAEGGEATAQGKKDWVIDLTGGYYHFDPMWEGSSFPGEWVDCPTFPDLDGDGTEDIMLTVYQVRSFGFIEEMVAVPLAGGSIDGSVTLKGTEEAPFASITFRLDNSEVKSEYKIKINGGWAVTDCYDEELEMFVEKTVASAAPGAMLQIKSKPMRGQYVNEWKSSGISISGPKNGDETCPVLGLFVMPAHDVTVNPVTLNQKPYVLELKRGTLGEGLTEYTVGTVEGFAETYGGSGDGLIDLDGDGFYDLLSTGWKSTTAYAAPVLHSTGKEYKIDTLNTGPYYPITIRFPEGAYTLDLSEGVILGEYLNEEILKKLAENLKQYESPEHRDYYDIDGDGQLDIRMALDNSMLTVLESYSLGESYVIPAYEFGINHKITLLCKKAPVYYSLEVENGKGGSVSVYEQAQFSQAFPIDYISPDNVVKKGYTAKGQGNIIAVEKESESMQAAFYVASGNRFLKGTAVYLMIEPEEGYHLKTVTCAGQEYGEEFGSCIINMTGDISVKVVFEKDAEPTPTPTPTDIPTSSPEDISGALEPTKVSSDMQGENGEAASGSDTDKNGNQTNSTMILVIVGGIVITVLAVMVFITKKKEAEYID